VDADLLRTHTLREPGLLGILAAALDAVEPHRIVRNFLQEKELPGYKRLFLLGIGKAAEPMTLAAADVFTNFTDALIVTKFTSRPVRDKVTILESGHPLPDARSLAAGQAVLDFVSRLNEDDLLICLISGGGSALVVSPAEGITLEDIRSKTSQLLAGGAAIREINLLRSKLDTLKGGGLVRATKARVLSLILSDVIGNSLETIASGLTVDPSLGDRVQNVIVGDIQTAARAAFEQAKRSKFEAEILSLNIQGEAREAGVRLARKLVEENKWRRHPFCLIAGGETTVTLKGGGKGGRNQELALGAVDELGGVENILLISLATDGDDGPTDAAGAVVDGESRQRAEKLGMHAADHLSGNDAYPFFQALDDLIKCGYSGTNVNDLIFLFGL